MEKHVYSILAKKTDEKSRKKQKKPTNQTNIPHVSILCPNPHIECTYRKCLYEKY